MFLHFCTLTECLETLRKPRLSSCQIEINRSIQLTFLWFFLILRSLSLIICFYLSCCFSSWEHALKVVLEVALAAWKSKVDGRIASQRVCIVSRVQKTVFYLGLSEVQVIVILQTQRSCICNVILISIQFLLIIVGLSQIHQFFLFEGISSGFSGLGKPAVASLCAASAGWILFLSVLFLSHFCALAKPKWLRNVDISCIFISFEVISQSVLFTNAFINAIQLNWWSGPPGGLVRRIPVQLLLQVGWSFQSLFELAGSLVHSFHILGKFDFHSLELGFIWIGLTLKSCFEAFSLLLQFFILLHLHAGHLRSKPFKRELIFFLLSQNSGISVDSLVSGFDRGLQVFYLLLVAL